MSTEPSSGAVLEHLAALGVAYEVVECDPDFADTAQFCERYGYSMDASAGPLRKRQARLSPLAWP